MCFCFLLCPHLLSCCHVSRPPLFVSVSFREHFEGPLPFRCYSSDCCLTASSSSLWSAEHLIICLYERECAERCFVNRAGNSAKNCWVKLLFVLVSIPAVSERPVLSWWKPIPLWIAIFRHKTLLRLWSFSALPASCASVNITYAQICNHSYWGYREGGENFKSFLTLWWALFFSH